MKKNNLIITVAAVLLVISMTFFMAACRSEKKDDPLSSQSESSEALQEEQLQNEAEEEQAPQDEEQSEEKTESEDGSGEDAAVQVQGGEDQAAEYVVKLSYANTEYIESGNENLPKLIRNVERRLQVKGDSPEELILGIADSLETSPDGVKGAETMSGRHFKVIGADIESGTAVVNISGSGIEDADMYEETFFIYQIADSVINSVNGINSVQFIIDGGQDRELQYVDISEAFTAADCKEFAN